MNFNDIITRSLKSLESSTKRTKSTAILGDLTTNFLSGSSSAYAWLDTYNTNPRLSVIHKISQDNGSTPFTIRGSRGTKEYIIKNHPLEKAINEHSVPQFFALWTAYRLMQGEVYIAYDLVGGTPSDLKVFSRYHKVGSHEDYYEFKYGDGTKTYPRDQVIVDLDLDLGSPYSKGKGKAESIKDEVETDEIVQKYIKNFYFNSARPDMIITAEAGEDMSDDDVKRIETSWINKFQGYANAHKPVFLNWAAKVISVPTNHREMELLDTRRFYRDTIIQHFNTPPEIMGIVENSNKATVIAAEHIYAKQVRMPLLHLMELLVNTKLMPRFPNSLNMRLAFDNIIPDDVELELSLLKEAKEASAITINEWRTRMGFPEIKSDYGRMMVGSAPPMEPVEIEQREITSRNYKDYQEFVTEEFVARASARIGKELNDDTIILFTEEEQLDATA